MLHFESDYIEGTHPEILAYFTEVGDRKLTGYGTDEICDSAKEKIRKACNCPDAEIFFLSGGTQSNLVVIRSLLRLYEGVISANTGHVNGHEAGAIEAGGHKVLTLPHHNGKLDPEETEQYIIGFYQDENHEHIVKPGMVYISQPTEYGTLYSLDELQRLHEVCEKYSIPLYLDGARLGYALASPENDMTLEDIAKYCDVFYIGGTKVGAMLGEAVVFPRHLVDGFFTIVKQSGALLAKGWILGGQFDALFSNDLYYRCGKNAIDMAARLKEGLKEKGYTFYLESPTNQQFLILENNQLEALKEKASFGFWEIYDPDHVVVRLATSWGTKIEEVEALLELM
ncbi:aminotransferase class V-fold PLP-dependent enzyme [bacterium]|nr:aminotransferase class V-fold PLP-dependent enzyme [Parasporobacterium sp.]MBR4489393.1 aminotransferase class V-fold PLP-dependent enzyme [bacterium]